MVALNIVQQKRCILFAQNYKSLSLNLFDEVTKRLEEMHVPYHYDKGQMVITYKNGTCYGFSYERPDAVRGITEIEYLYLDEIALAPSDILAIAGPCCRGNFTPKIRFASSPRIGSYWDNWVKEGMQNGSIEVFTATMLDNKFLSKESIDLQLSAISDPLLLRQEIYGEILDDTDGNQLVHNSDFIKENVLDNYMWKFGIDASGEGHDKASITLRKGHIVKDIKRFPKLTGDEALYQIDMMTKLYDIPYDAIQGVYIDMAYGEAIYERVSTKYNAVLVPFASKADDIKFLNKRAEMYWRLKRYANDGMTGMTDEDLKQELLATRWMLDKNDRIQIIPKEEIKQVIRRSPDSADSLALTFYEEDYVYQTNINSSHSADVYTILGDPDD